MKNINAKLVSPLNEKELVSTRSANKAYFSWILDKLKGYNYKNETLINLLVITEEEQTQLKTIISKKEKARRRANKKAWSNDKRDKSREEIKLDINDNIAIMLKSGNTYDEIIARVNVSNDKISRIAEKEGRKLEKIEIDNKIMEMLNNGCRYSDIMNTLKVSNDKIVRIKKKLRD